MLVKFAVENWMSFKDVAEFSAVATREKQHGDRLPKIKKFPLRLLPVSSIYGGNASGKSNFIEALNFAKNFIANAKKNIDDPTGIKPFKLDSKNVNKPTRFSFSILIEDNIYDYSFALNEFEILEEKLSKTNSTASVEIFDRSSQDASFITTDKTKERDKTFLEYVSRSVPKNELLLTHAVRQNVTFLKSVYEWFSKKLQIITPISNFRFVDKFIDSNDPMTMSLNTLLRELDTGIDHLEAKEIDINSAGVPSSVLDNMRKLAAIKGDEEVSKILRDKLQISLASGRNVVRFRKGELHAYELVSSHIDEEGNSVQFKLEDESDGTNRLIEIIPAFVLAERKDYVIVIDELDRSLHTNLTRFLLEHFLDRCSAETRSQLIFSTHDVTLMDQKLFRRDEIWFTERQGSGATTLYPASDFHDVRYDKDLVRSYRIGRLGGTPKIVSRG